MDRMHEAGRGLSGSVDARVDGARTDDVRRGDARIGSPRTGGVWPRVVRAWTSGVATARPAAAALLLGAALATAAAGLSAAEGAPGVVNVNTATVEELVRVPGIGEKRAQAILDAREQRGGFKSVDELVEIRGIGPANLEKLRPHLSVSGKSGTPQ
ncbi:ComEA family DNA-binding protein [Myxococcota bacterium]|nr:ComEA family DNA-binding protein [Myxococcota bacterium]MCZ7617273.1 helix-hairpin-helix domain-containing protein [Myxococcota bacterium]